MQKVIVRVHGVGSISVEGVDPKEIYKEIDFHFGITKGWVVHKAKRGAPKKVKPVISEGAAGGSEQG